MNRKDETTMSDEERPQAPPEAKRERGGPGHFLREVRGELKRVQWPSRREVISYSLVVLVSVSLLTLYVFGLDQAFGQLVFWIFG